MISCPPLTRHTAASSSRTKALVLQNRRQNQTLASVDSAAFFASVAFFAVIPGVPVVEAESNFVDGVGMSHHHVEPVLRKRSAGHQSEQKQLNISRLQHQIPGNS